MSRQYESTDARSYLRNLERRVSMMERRRTGPSALSTEMHSGKLGSVIPACVENITPSDTPPDPPAEGACDIWIDTSLNPPIPRMWDGTDWIKITDQDLLDALRGMVNPIVIEGGSEMPPYDPRRRVGSLWRDPATGILYYWDGQRWVRVVAGDTKHQDKVREDIEAARDEIADTGAELDQRLTQAREDLDAARLDIDDARDRLAAAEVDIQEASDEIAQTGAELTQRLDQAALDLQAAEDRVTATEDALKNAAGELVNAGQWIEVTGAELNTRLSDAQDALDAAFPSGPFDVDAAIDDAVAGVGGSLITYSNITEANKPGDAPTSTAGRKTGDIHRNRNQTTGEVYAEWILGSSGTWQPVNFGDLILRNLDVGKITGGSGAFLDFVTQNLTSNSAVIDDLWTNVVRSRKITTDMLIVGGGENVFPDPWFQDDEGWNPDDSNADGVTVRGSADGPGGREMVLWQSAQTQFHYYHGINHRGVQLTPGGTYKLRYAARRGGTSPHVSNLRFYIRYNRADGTTATSSYLIPAPETFSFTPYEAEITIPTDMAGGCTVAFWRMANDTSAVLIADASLVSMVDSSLVVDGGILAKHITITGDPDNPDEVDLVAGIASILHLTVDNLYVPGTATIETGIVEELWTQVVRSRKITTDMLLVGRGTNLAPPITDPSLGDTSWTKGGTGTGEITSSSYSASGWAFRADTSQPGVTTWHAPDAVSEAIPVRPGEHFRISCKVGRIGDGTLSGAGRWYLGLALYNSAGATIGFRYPSSLANVTESASWDTRYEGNTDNGSDLPSDTAYVRIRVYIEGATGTPSSSSIHTTIYDINVVSMADASVIVDGGITARKITIVGDPDDPDEVGLVANMASILHLTAENFYVTGTATIEESIINELWTQVVRSRKITTDMLLVGPGINMVVDPGFRDDDLNAERTSISTGTWGLYSTTGGVLRFMRASPNSSTSALRLVSRDNVYVEVEPGRTYQFKWKARVTNGAGATRVAVTWTNTTGGASYVAVTPSAFAPATSSWEWYEASWVAPDNAVTMKMDVQVQAGNTGDVDVAAPMMVVDGASLIVDGSITAKHVDVESIAATIGDFEIVLSESVILSGTTGRIATSAGGPRVELKGNTLSAYSVLVNGTNMIDVERVRVDPDGLRVYGLDGNQMLAATGSGIEAVGTLKTSRSGAGVTVAPSTTMGGGTIKFDDPDIASGAFMEVQDMGTVAQAGRLRIGGPSISTVLSTIPFIDLYTHSSLGATCNISVDRINSGGAGTQRVLVASNDEFVSAGGMIEHNGTDFYVTTVPSRTTTATPNVFISSTGRFTVNNSLSEFKIAQEDLRDEEWAKVKDLRPVTWIDRTDAEAVAEAMETGNAAALEDAGQLVRQIGLIAQDVERIGSKLATYDGHGALTGVAYDRLAVALLPWLHELEARLDRLEGAQK